jgi:hypothetical protein
MFFALRVIAFAMLFSRGVMGLCGVLVMFGCFFVFVVSHYASPG